MNSLHWLRILGIVTAATLGVSARAVDDVFLFTYFTGNGEDGLHLASSEDGYHWTALKGGGSFLAPAVGKDKLMRDPCVARGPDGTYRLVWTSGWWDNGIGYASTQDFVTWSEEKNIPVMAHEPKVRNAWAPEVAWDAKRGQFLIFWASTIPGKFPETAGASEDDLNHRIYCTTTKDWQTFTPTRLFCDPGFSVIDATLLPRDDGKFSLIVKDETKNPPKKHLRIATADDIEGPWRDFAPPFTRDWVEGPTAIKVGGDTLVYFDVYREHHYGAMRSRDLKTWEDVTDKTAVPAGARHGTMIAVPRALVAKLQTVEPAKTAATPAPDLAANPAAVAAVLNPALPSLFVASDSTAAKGSGEKQQGWGVPFADYFDPAKINVVNRARGGRSSRTFISEGLWDKLIADVKAGDTVLIQFGHNDASPVNEDLSVPRERMRSRGSIPGIGEETQEIDNVITKKHEVVHTFGWYLRKMIADVQAKGATPIVLSLTVRNIWKDGVVERGSGNYRAWDRAVAQAAGVEFVDLTRIIADKYQALGEERVKEFFTQDHTHTNAIGADFNAAAVVGGLKGIRKNTWDKYLSEKGAAVEPDHIGWLNLPEPAQPELPSVVLIGDSTVRNGRGDGAGGQWGWGDEIGKFFDETKINVVNRAIGGLSSRTFLTQGHWDRAQTLLKRGDFVIMQFGHNDDGPLNDNSRARGTIKGVGEETEAIDNILTKQHEIVHSYGWYLRKYIRDAKERGATPIVCSPIPRKTWKDGKIVRSNVNGYAAWAKEVAASEGVAFIDLNDLVAQKYEAMGPEKVEPMFADPHTHTSLAGAELNAAIVAEALRDLPGAPLKEYLKADGR